MIFWRQCFGPSRDGLRESSLHLNSQQLITMAGVRLAALCLCAAALPPEELQVLQQLLQLAPEPCNTGGVTCRDGHVTPLGLRGRLSWMGLFRLASS